MIKPDELISEHGVDVTRLALLFTRPWDADGDWDPAVLAGAERFLARVWRLATGPAGGAGAEHVAETVERVTVDIDQMRFNTAIAALMTLVSRLKGEPPAPDVVRTLVQLVAPFALHLAEELWGRIGGEYSVHNSPWPDGGLLARATTAGDIRAP